jgi:hypothetical protein
MCVLENNFVEAARCRTTDLALFIFGELGRKSPFLATDHEACPAPVPMMASGGTMANIHVASRLSLTSLMMGQTMREDYPGFGTKSGRSLRSKVMGSSDHLRYSGVAGETAMTS